LDRVHRRELKHDKFVEQVGHSVEYASEHRQQLVRWASIAVGALVLIVGVYFFVNRQASVRQDELRDAIRLQQANVGAEQNAYVMNFPTQADKDKAVEKSFADLANKYGGKKEGDIARFYLGAMYSDKGNVAEAEKQWKQLADSGEADYASQAKFSLAQLYDAEGRQPDAEKLLRQLIDHPTILVSKEQAQIALGRILARTKPDEARKLLEPLRTERAAVSRVAINALSDISPAR
jgi:lipopolysaccharide biosynthesis regulator YciM